MKKLILAAVIAATALTSAVSTASADTVWVKNASFTAAKVSISGDGVEDQWRQNLIAGQIATFHVPDGAEWCVKINIHAANDKEGGWCGQHDERLVMSGNIWTVKLQTKHDYDNDQSIVF